MSNVRVRYGRFNLIKLTRNGEALAAYYPKNTLVTFKEHGVIYFGISRCNVKMDNFKKEVGKRIALGRLELSQNEDFERKENLDYEQLAGSTLEIHKSGLRGVVHETDIKHLLDYFKNIDDECARRGGCQ
jgi:hypothetical protein